MNDDRARSRRSFLAAVGAGAVAGVAGCSGENDATSTGVGGTTAATTTATGTTETATTTATTTTTTPSLDESAFAQFRGGLRRRGYYPDAPTPDQYGVGWRVRGINKGDHTAAKSSVVPLPSGDLVVPGDTGNVYRFTPEGEFVWAAPTNPSTYGIHGTPAVANGAVYVGAYDGATYAFDAETGDRIWRTKLGDAIGSSPAYHDGEVYVAVEYFDPDGKLFALDARTGEVLREATEPRSHPHSTPAIDPDAGKLVVGANDNNVYCWDWPELEHAWTFTTGNEIKGPVAIHDGAAYFGSWDKYVYRVDLETGEQDWFYRTNDWVMSGPSIDPELGRMYVGSHDDYVHAVELRNGTRAWRQSVGGWVIGCPAVFGDAVLCGSVGERVEAIDRRTGEQLWHYPTVGWATSTPRLVGDGIYFADMATEERVGSLYKLVLE